MENLYKNERWRAVVGFEGFYEVSSMGRVRSISRTVNGRLYEGRILKQTIDRYGYKRVGLSKHGKQYKIRVHILVGKAFIPNPENKPQLNHIDGAKRCNLVENLEWVTHKENVKHAVDGGMFLKSLRHKEQQASLN